MAGDGQNSAEFCPMGHEQILRISCASLPTVGGIPKGHGKNLVFS